MQFDEVKVVRGPWQERLQASQPQVSVSHASGKCRFGADVLLLAMPRVP